MIDGVVEFRKMQELKQLRATQRALDVDIIANRNALRNLVAKANQLDQDAMKQQSLLYSQAYLIQQLERKVRRAQGERSDEEKEQLKARIDELTQQLEEKKRTNTILTSQHRKATDDVRQAKRLLASLEKERSAVNENIAEMALYNESAGAQLAAKIREKEEMMVEENILRLELRKLRSFLNARADNVLSLENRQAQLQLALEERTKEIEIHKDMLKAHIKTTEEERYSAVAELRDRLSKVDKLKRKYEIIMTHLGSDDGEEHTQAYFLIKASQVRLQIVLNGSVTDDPVEKGRVATRR